MYIKAPTFLSFYDEAIHSNDHHKSLFQCSESFLPFVQLIENKVPDTFVCRLSFHIWKMRRGRVLQYVGSPFTLRCIRLCRYMYLLGETHGPVTVLFLSRLPIVLCTDHRVTKC